MSPVNINPKGQIQMSLNSGSIFKSKLIIKYGLAGGYKISYLLKIEPEMCAVKPFLQHVNIQKCKVWKKVPRTFPVNRHNEKLIN